VIPNNHTKLHVNKNIQLDQKKKDMLSFFQSPFRGALDKRINKPLSKSYPKQKQIRILRFYHCRKTENSFKIKATETNVFTGYVHIMTRILELIEKNSYKQYS